MGDGVDPFAGVRVGDGGVVGADCDLWWGGAEEVARGEVVFAGEGRGGVAVFEEWDGVEWDFAQTDEVDAHAVHDEAFGGGFEHFVVYFEVPGARGDDDDADAGADEVAVDVVLAELEGCEVDCLEDVAVDGGGGTAGNDHFAVFFWGVFFGAVFLRGDARGGLGVCGGGCGTELLDELGGERGGPGTRGEGDCAGEDWGGVGLSRGGRGGVVVGDGEDEDVAEEDCEFALEAVEDDCPVGARHGGDDDAVEVAVSATLADVDAAGGAEEFLRLFAGAVEDADGLAVLVDHAGEEDDRDEVVRVYAFPPLEQLREEPVHELVEHDFAADAPAAAAALFAALVALAAVVGVKVPHLLAHLDEEDVVRALGAEDGDGAGGEEAGLDLLAADPDVADGAADRLDEEELLGVVGTGVGQERGRHAPHVAAGDVLVAEVDFDVGGFVEGFIDLGESVWVW